MKRINQILKAVIPVVIICIVTGKGANAQDWTTLGNTGTNAATNFIGTKDAADFVVRTQNAERIRIASTGATTFKGSVGVRGAANNLYALNINASGRFGGIIVTDPVNNYAFYNVKTGNNPSVYVENTSQVATGSVIKSISHSSAHAVEGINSYSGTGIFGSSYFGTGVYGSDGAGGNGVKGYSTSGFGTVGSTTDGPAGVYGFSSGTGDGVFANSTEGIGIDAVSSGSSAAGGYAGKFTSNNYRGIYVSGGASWYTAYFNGDTYSTGSYLGSDEKLKRNIKDFSNAMDIINSLKPKNYEYRNDGNYAKMNLPKGIHYGLIAQDLEQVLPNLVKTETFETRDAALKKVTTEDGKIIPVKVENESIDFKAVNYTELIPVMIKAMQEQSKIIESQQIALKEQSEKIEALISLANKLSDVNATGSSVENTNNTPVATTIHAVLEQNAPNPFSSNTIIRYKIPATGNAKLIITNTAGNVVKTLSLTAKDNGRVTVYANELVAGTYYYSLLVDGKKTGTKKMILVK